MGKTPDLTGQRFSRLTVISKAGKAANSKTLWNCQCDCGNIVQKIHGNLTSGNDHSCGCLKLEIQSNRAKKYNLIGQKFGKLTVVEKVGKNQKTQILWNCKCECGNYKEVITSQLLHGCVKSCGCSSKIGNRKDLTGQKFGKLTVWTLDKGKSRFA